MLFKFVLFNKLLLTDQRISFRYHGSFKVFFNHKLFMSKPVLHRHKVIRSVFSKQNQKKCRNDQILRELFMYKLYFMFFSISFSLLLQGCATNRSSRSLASTLALGMTKAEVEELIGRSWDINKSSSGNGEVNHVYGERGYVWYNEKNELKGFGSYVDTPSFPRLEISRASGYQINNSSKRKIYFYFEPYSDLKSSEARMVFLENKKYIEKAFTKFGYTVVANKEKAELIIVTKLGISDPKVSQEIVSSPEYNYNYVQAQKTTTNVYGSSGAYLGSASTTHGNPYGSFQANYAGQRTHTITSTTFIRSLEFIAIDPSIKNSQENLLWSTLVVSEGSSDDIRQIFPYLLYASLPVVNKSQTYKSYTLAGYHTGVFELMGIEVPVLDRSPSGRSKISEGKSICNIFLSAIKYQGCN